MEQVTEISKNISDYSNMVMTNEKLALSKIHQDDKNVAVFNRNTTHLKHEIVQFLASPVQLKLSGKVDEILDELKAKFHETGSQFPLLFADIKELLYVFKEVTKAKSFQLMLTGVKTDMCRKFHSDINDLRILCTYYGPGTLWLPKETIDKKAYSADKDDFIIDESLIQQVATGDAVILKGALYRNSDPVLHKSPPVEAQGEQRLLLRIDTNEFVNLFL